MSQWLVLMIKTLSTVKSVYPSSAPDVDNEIASLGRLDLVVLLKKTDRARPRVVQEERWYNVRFVKQNWNKSRCLWVYMRGFVSRVEQDI